MLDRSAMWLIAAGALAACSAPAPPGHPGYVEGEYVYVAAPQSGRLDQLHVHRGDEVAIDAPLFALEAESEAAARRQAQEQLRGAQAQLSDLRVGKRPQELDVTRAQLAQAQAEEIRSAAQLARDEAQFRIGGIARAQLDDSRASQAANAARVRQLQSELEVARLPGRGEQIRAQEAQVAAARAALDQAVWKLDQKAIGAPASGRVTDTLYRVGEWVQAGSPVVKLLPPANVKVRFFVPETIVGGLATGRPVSIRCDGCSAEVPATLTYVASEAEFTPPVIYSNETRSKLVFMVEARPAVGDAGRLRPGQPVSVMLR
jgi:HlyD family secretion protein